MKLFHCLTASAVLSLMCMPAAFAAPKAHGNPAPIEVRSTLEKIDVQSAAVAEAAYSLADMARWQLDPQMHAAALAKIRVDVNQIGDELKSLEARRAALSTVEQTALDQIIPLMVQVADNAEKATLEFNEDHRNLINSPYLDETVTMSKDADKVSSLAHNSLKLEKTREQEARLEHNLGNLSVGE